MAKSRRNTESVTVEINEDLQRLSKDTGIAPDKLVKAVSEALPFIPRPFVFELRDGRNAKVAMMRIFDCAGIGKGIIDDIEEALGIKGFIVDDASCEVYVKSASDFRVWVHMNASIDRVPKSINLDEIDVDIDQSNAQVIYTRTFEKLNESTKEHIKKKVSENQESCCDELTEYSEDYELSFDDIDDEYSNLQLTVQSEDLDDSPKAEDVSKVFDKICA